MNRKTIICLITLIITISVVMSARYARGKVWEDERIGVVLDKVERSDSLPDELRGKGLPTKLQNVCDYVILYLTVSRIKHGYITNMKESILIDTEAKEYKTIGWFFRGASFRDRHNVASDFWLGEGATSILVYELPIQTKPATLNLIYSYIEWSWDEKIIKHGQININILK